MRGADSEQRALDWLERRGLRLLARNWRCPRGELDLVMLDGRELVFVEVRSRASATFGDAAASVDGRKQQRLILAAGAYLASHPEHATRATRFDVMAFDGTRQPRWLQAAFDADA